MSPSPSAAIVADEKPPTLPGLSAGVPHPCSGGGRKRYSSPTCSPSSRSAFRLATLVWELTWSGGAPGLTTASKPTPPAVLAPTTPAAEAEAETPSTPGLVADGAAFLPSTPMPSAELPKTPEPGPLFTPRTPAALAEAAAELIFPSRPNEVSAVESFRATSWPLPFTVPATEVAASTVFVCPRLNTPPIPEPAIAVAASASGVRTVPRRMKRLSVFGFRVILPTSATAKVRSAEGACAVDDLEVRARLVQVADQPEPVGSRGDRGKPADVSRTVECHEGAGGAGDVRTMRRLQVSVAGVVVRDQPKTVGADRRRRVRTHVPSAVESRDGSGRALYVAAVGDLEISVRDVVVADESQHISPEGQRRESAHVSRGIDRSDDAPRAGHVRAVKDPEVSVREVVQADEPEPVRAGRDRGIQPTYRGAVERGNRPVRAPRVRAVRDLQPSVGRVVVADEREAVGGDGNRGV